RQAPEIDQSAVLSAALVDSVSFCSSPFAGIAPLTRVPSAKNNAGVPVTIRLRPSAKLAWIGVSQSAVAGVLPSSIQSRHAASGFSAHQMLRERSCESCDRMGYRKV